MGKQIGSIGELSFAEICKKVDEYTEYYNYHRVQERLNWMTSKEYTATLELHRMSTARGSNHLALAPRGLLRE